MSYDVIDTDGKVTRLTVLDLNTPISEHDDQARRAAARLGVTVREIWRIEIEERRVKLD